MQNYQQYLSLPPHHQLPPLAASSNLHQLPTPVFTYGETQPGGVSGKCSLPTPGFLSIKPPTSLFYQLRPENYTYGFNSSGKIIGVNQEIPYPFPNTKYHDHPFFRSVDWYTTDVLSGTSYQEVLKKKDVCQGKEPSVNQTETAEYFTADNDEGYKKWIAKKIQEQQTRNEKQAQIRIVPPEIKSLPGHVGPSTRETTNETYGQYLDLRPKYPAVYPLPAKIAPMPMHVVVKFRHSNMSDHPPIPDHAFAVDPREMINKDGCYSRGIQGSVFYAQGPEPQPKTAFTFRQNAVLLGQTVGERAKGFTFPLHSPTGLEINRPLSRCVSIVAGVDGKKKFRTLMPARSVPYIYNRYMSYTVVPSHDPDTERNPASRHHKQICVPFNPQQSSNPQCDPCNVNFINPQVLPVSVELRKPPTC